MSITIPQVPLCSTPAAGKPEDLILRLSVEQYHGMVRAGILTSDDLVELLEGWLVCKMPKNPPHSMTTRLVQQALEGIVPAGWYVDSQEPVTLGDSEPEPDVAIIRGSTRDYKDRHPGPKDVALLVEVADATRDRDRGTKQRLYARSEIAVYWIINLAERLIEIYTDPSGPAEESTYRQSHNYRTSDSVPVVIEGREIRRITVSDLLPD